MWESSHLAEEKFEALSQRRNTDSSVGRLATETDGFGKERKESLAELDGTQIHVDGGKSIKGG